MIQMDKIIQTRSQLKPTKEANPISQSSSITSNSLSSQNKPLPDNEESKLNDRANDVYAHVTNQDWQQVHGYFLPEFQEFCPVEQYTNKNVKGMKVLNHMLGIPEEDSLEFSVIETSVDGSAGQVYIDISYQGKSLDLGQSNTPRKWVLEHGEWWSNPEDWEKECPR